MFNQFGKKVAYIITILLVFLGMLYSGLFSYLIVNGGWEHAFSWKGWSAVLTFSTFLNLFVLIFILVQLYYQYRSKAKDELSLTMVTLNNLYTQANYAYQEADRVLRQYPRLPKKISEQDKNRVGNALKKCEQCICYLQQINIYEKQIEETGVEEISTHNYDLELNMCLKYIELWRNVEFKPTNQGSQGEEQPPVEQLPEAANLLEEP